MAIYCICMYIYVHIYRKPKLRIVERLRMLSIQKVTLIHGALSIYGEKYAMQYVVDTRK